MTGTRRRSNARRTTGGLPKRNVGEDEHRIGPSSAMKVSHRRSRSFRHQESRLPGIMDCSIAATVLFLSFVTRLAGLEYPPKIIFDEFHFSKFVDDYAAGRYLFDIHPPLGKLVLFAVAKLGGYRVVGPEYGFDRIGKPYGHVVYFPQRLLSAIVGSFVPLLLYSICRVIHVGMLPALTAAVLSISDNLLLIESRLILIDAQVVFYTQFTIFAALNMWKKRKRTVSRLLWLLATAFFGGCALSTKWTALAAPVLIAIVSIFGSSTLTSGRRLDLLEMLLAGSVASAVYVSSFFVHFWLLPLDGPGAAFMPCWFRVHLVGNKDCDEADSAMSKPSFWKSFLFLNREMYRANRDVESRHHWESAWYEWTLNLRGVLYLDEATEVTDWTEKIYLIVNPFLAPVAVIGVVVCLAWVLLCTVRLRSAPSRARLARSTATSIEKSRPSSGSRESPGLDVVVFFLCGYLMNLLPYAAIKRCTFVYHYLPSLQHAIVLVALALELTTARRSTPRILASFVIMLFAIVAFALYSPWVYALPLSKRAHNVLRRMPRWD